MGRRKKYSQMNLNPSGKTEQCCWTTAMDDALIDAFVREESLGNRASTGTFTSQAYDNIMRDLRGKFRDRPLDKERIKNRIKYIKKNFAPCFDIFKNGLEGFTWNPATKLWTAEPDNWDRLIEVCIYKFGSTKIFGYVLYTIPGVNALIYVCLLWLGGGGVFVFSSLVYL
jgi:Myb/SANT-like DNA-binding domain